jgi:hypothetical protein
MASSERRRAECPRLAALKHELNADQLETLRQLEMFGWELKFVRRPPFQEPTPVVFDGGRQSFAVIRGDGSLDADPSLDLRH